MVDGRAEVSTGNTVPGDATTEGVSPQKVEAAFHWRRSRRSIFRRVQFIMTALTALTAVAALVLSIITTMQLHRRADMFLTMPTIIRITQGDLGPQYPQYPVQVQIAMQPTFAVYEKTDVTSIVTSVRLNMTPPPQTNVAPPYFYWIDVVEYVYDLPTNKVNGTFVSDPTPIVVTQDKPQTPVLRFFAMPARLTVGRWKGTITAERQGQSPLVSEFCLVISADNLSALIQTGVHSYVIMRNDQSPQPSSSPQTSNCYRAP
jgi:hypothetical protein